MRLSVQIFAYVFAISILLSHAQRTWQLICSICMRIVCLACYSGCATCSGTGHNECLTCISPRILDYNNACVCKPSSIKRALKSNQFFNLVCYSTCKTCKGEHDYDCTSCDSPKVYNNGRCYGNFYCNDKC